MELVKFWRFIRKRVWVAIALVFVSCVATVAVCLAFKPVYQNTATIWIQPQSLEPDFVSQMPNSLAKLGYIDSKSIMDTFTRLFSSERTLVPVIKKMDLKKDDKLMTVDDLFDPGTISLYLTQQLGVNVEQYKDSEILEITGYSSSPTQATDLANAVVDSFFENCFQLMKKEAAKARKELESQAALLEKDWQAAEARKKAFMNTNNVISLDIQKQTAASARRMRPQ